MPAQSVRLQRLSQPRPGAAARERPSQRLLVGAKHRRLGAAPGTAYPRGRAPPGDGGPARLGHGDGGAARSLPARHHPCHRYRPALSRDAAVDAAWREEWQDLGCVGLRVTAQRGACLLGAPRPQPPRLRQRPRVLPRKWSLQWRNQLCPARRAMSRTGPRAPDQRDQS